MKFRPDERSLAAFLTMAGILSRFFPHPPNFTAVGAACLFAGAQLKGRKAYLIPLAVMLITDPLLGVTMGFQPFNSITPFVYGGFLLSVWLGRQVAGRGVGSIIGASLASSTQFFLISNFGVWLCGTTYPLNGGGLLACYVAAIPFFGRTLAGDLIYTGVLFGAYGLISRRLAAARCVGSESGRP